MPHRRYAYYPTLFSLKNTIITQQRNNKIKAIIRKFNIELQSQVLV